MGEIKKVLAMGEIEPRTITARSIWTDLCENIHLHFRNLRIDFSEIEFSTFRAAMYSLGMAVEQVSEEKNYKEGDPNYLIQQMFNIPIKSDSDYYKNRVLIELQRDNTVHFHYRDIRLHFSLPEFKTIANIFTGALLNLRTMVEFPYKHLEKAERHTIDLDLIQPYDAGHRPLAIDDHHREGIEFVKELMRKGEVIRPILVSTEGQRLDGFKRYMAHLESGLSHIECIVDPFGKMGGQHNQSLIDDPIN